MAGWEVSARLQEDYIPASSQQETNGRTTKTYNHDKETSLPKKRKLN